MLSYINNSSTAVIILHEIYGINQHITSFAKKMSENGIDVICPNLLDTDKPFSYDQEAIAYDNFINNIGFEKASTQLLELLREISEQYKHVYIIGFSVGATIAWLCCTEENLCDAVIGFYGSRIRDYLNIDLKVPILLLFATQEKSFNVSSLVSSLNKKPLVLAKTYNALHGFADPYSEKYCEQSANEAYKDLINFLNELRNDITHRKKSEVIKLNLF